MLRPWKLTLAEQIDASADVPIYMQIIHALIHEIQRGRLSPGTFLPSTRDLAELLSVNRKTIVLAYEDLIAQGWLASRGTRGTIVSESLPDTSPRQSNTTMSTSPNSMSGVEFLFKDAPPSPYAHSSRHWLTLDEGSPDCRLFPVDTLTRAYRSAIHRAMRANRLRYGDPRGSPILRDRIAGMLKAERGVMVSSDGVCITRGSQMAIFLAGRILLKPGDSVIVETLSYGPAVAAFQAAGAQILSVNLDKDGIDVEAVERLCRTTAIRAIYLTPHHHFPTTVALKPDRRLRLLDLARQYSFAIIEDDYDHEYHFQSQPLLPMASYAPSSTIYLGSLSKLVLPSLRIGYIAADPQVINAIAHEVLTLDRQGNTPTEEAMAELIELGELRRHVRKMTQVYAKRRLSFAKTLHKEMGSLINFKIPDGGLAFWVQFNDTADLDRFEANACPLGLRYAPSHSFMTSPQAERGLRLGFASLDETEATEAIRRMRTASGR